MKGKFNEYCARAEQIQKFLEEKKTGKKPIVQATGSAGGEANSEESEEN